MTQTFVKRQTTFEVIQFTGGEESAKEVGTWLFENFKITSMYQRAHDRKDGSPRGEIVFMNRRDKIFPGYWATRDSYLGELTVFTEEEFSRLFVAQEELIADSVGEEKFDMPGPLVTNEDTPPLAPFELDGLFSLGGVLHGRRADNGDIVPIVLVDDKPTLLVHAEAAFEVDREGNIFETVMYNEGTLLKVRKIIMDDGFGEADADRIINTLTNAGILFRERA